MKYIVYKITNLMNNKIYIGCHKTNNENDGYMGSGKLISLAIEKYGINSVTKEILASFETEKEMFAEERNLISYFDPEYNLHEGGCGGWSYVNKFGFNIDFKKQRELNPLFNKKGSMSGNKRKKELWQTNKFWAEKYSKALSIAGRDKKTFLGKHHTEEVKRKIGKSNSKHQRGYKNSQFNTMWITNGVENKKIKKLDCIPDGWNKGRTF